VRLPQGPPGKPAGIWSWEGEHSPRIFLISMDLRKDLCRPSQIANKACLIQGWSQRENDQSHKFQFKRLLKKHLNGDDSVVSCLSQKRKMSLEEQDSLS
jgi:hypothetical protein